MYIMNAFLSAYLKWRNKKNLKTSVYPAQVPPRCSRRTLTHKPWTLTWLIFWEAHRYDIPIGRHPWGLLWSYHPGLVMQDMEIGELGSWARHMVGCLQISSSLRPAELTESCLIEVPVAWEATTACWVDVLGGRKMRTRVQNFRLQIKYLSLFLCSKLSGFLPVWFLKKILYIL